MPSPIESALTTLLPSTNFLPPELLHLSASLLAQSRSKAASLKPEEEIGRTYACCNIACERLRNRLALEIGKPAPPVPPRIYKKLFTYLDSALKNVTSAPNTPRAKRTGSAPSSAATPTSTAARNANTAQKVDISPLKRKATGQASAKRSAKGVQKTNINSEASVPKFVMPMVRHICKSFGTPEAASHVYAGAASVIRLREAASDASETGSKKRKLSSGDSATTKTSEYAIPEDQLSALIVVLYLYVSTRMLNLETDQDRYLQRRAQGIAAIHSCYKTHISNLPVIQDDSSIVTSIEQFMRAAQDGWLEMEWFQNVPEPDTADVDMQEIQDSEDEGPKRPTRTPVRRQEKHAKRDVDLGGAGLQIGLGTMFQPAIDWLSDERRESYKEWKSDIMMRLEAMESAS